jgi:hypothetical protein
MHSNNVDHISQEKKVNDFVVKQITNAHESATIFPAGDEEGLIVSNKANTVTLLAGLNKELVKNTLFSRNQKTIPLISGSRL